MVQENLKALTVEEKIKILKEYLNNENDESKILALNVYTLIKEGNTFSDDFFESPDIMFSDIMNFLAIKKALTVELKQFRKRLIEIYVACLKHCTLKKDRVEKQTPIIYRYCLYLSDFQTLAKLWVKCENDIELDNTDYIDSFTIINSLAKKINIYDNFVLSQIPINNEENKEENKE